MKLKKILSFITTTIGAMSLTGIAYAAEATAEEGIPTAGFISQYSPILMIVIMFGVMYFFMIRPENKKKKEIAKMRSELTAGDEITTIGGIVGKVSTVRDEELTIVSSSDGTKLRIKRWAVSSVDKKRETNKELEVE